MRMQRNRNSYGRELQPALSSDASKVVDALPCPHLHSCTDSNAAIISSGTTYFHCRVQVMCVANSRPITETHQHTHTYLPVAVTTSAVEGGASQAFESFGIQLLPEQKDDNMVSVQLARLSSIWCTPEHCAHAITPPLRRSESHRLRIFM